MSRHDQFLQGNLFEIGVMALQCLVEQDGSSLMIGVRPAFGFQHHAVDASQALRSPAVIFIASAAGLSW
jgi:hypothetical protein